MLISNCELKSVLFYTASYFKTNAAEGEMKRDRMIWWDGLLGVHVCLQM